ncbi:MAG: hypothetical protein JNM94_02325 [Phycisphaerae bacterium]|nr:hypothetical protein [Phycisphaerae bacterium]
MTPELPTLVHVPPRLADIEFTVRLAAEFRELELPTEDVDFTNPIQFAPLYAAMASYGAVLLTVAARPAYDNGSLREWLGYLCTTEGLTLVSLERSTLNGRPTMVAEATQPSDAGVMRIRTHLIEDGGRLLNISIIAPDALWAGISPTLMAMQQTFELLRPRGSTVPLEPNAAPDADAATSSDSEPGADGGNAESSEAPFCTCLDPEHPTNVRLRDARVGLVPRVHEQATATRHALVAPAAIEALIRVPAGWHVLDDGTRTLVFDAAGRIQISLNLRPITDVDTFLRGVEREHRSQQPSLQTLITMLGRYPAILLHQLQVNGEQLEQGFLVHPEGCDRDGLMLVARVTAAEKDMGDAMELIDTIFGSVLTPRALTQA